MLFAYEMAFAPQFVFRTISGFAQSVVQNFVLAGFEFSIGSKEI
jgi:hypothetical protein